jgi:hypothetical protein
VLLNRNRIQPEPQPEVYYSHFNHLTHTGPEMKMTVAFGLLYRRFKAGTTTEPHQKFIWILICSTNDAALLR